MGDLEGDDGAARWICMAAYALRKDLKKSAERS
jgi:hypothetical protein